LVPGLGWSMLRFDLWFSPATARGYALPSGEKSP